MKDACRSTKDLETEIVELVTTCQSTGDRGCIEILKSKKKKKKKMALANLLENRVQGALIRSQFLDITEMDAPSNVFVRLEKKRGQSKAIQLLAL